MEARIGHLTDTRDTRRAFRIIYRRWSDTRSSHVRIPADDLSAAKAALTAHLGNTRYSITSII